jgi:hypothetical protein
MNISPDIELTRFRCFDCGRYYMVETARRGACPVCAQSRIDKLLTERAVLERSNAALRGANKRTKRSAK